MSPDVDATDNPSEPRPSRALPPLPDDSDAPFEPVRPSRAARRAATPLSPDADEDTPDADPADETRSGSTSADPRGSGQGREAAERPAVTAPRPEVPGADPEEQRTDGHQARPEEGRFAGGQATTAGMSAEQHRALFGGPRQEAPTDLPRQPTEDAARQGARDAVSGAAPGPTPPTPGSEQPTDVQPGSEHRGPQMVGPAPQQPTPSGRQRDTGTAWEDPTTRRLAGKRRWPFVVALVIGVLCVAGVVALLVTSQLQHAWGLPVLVVLAGVAGGCIAGGVLGLVAWLRLCSVLKAAPWEAGRLELGWGVRARLLEDEGPGVPLELEVRADKLGEQGARVPIELAYHDERFVFATEGRGRLVRTWPDRRAAKELSPGL